MLDISLSELNHSCGFIGSFGCSKIPLDSSDSYVTLYHLLFRKRKKFQSKEIYEQPFRGCTKMLIAWKFVSAARDI